MSFIDGYLIGVVFCAHMQITNRHWAAAGIGFVVAIGAFFAWSYRAQAPSPTGTSDATASSTDNSAPAATTTPAVTYTGPFPINKADTIASWDFKGAYADSDTLIAQANADITHLTGLIGKGQYDDYDLYNGIANDYVSLGNGKTAYQYYNRSIQIHPAKGLAYANLAHLMDQLGAYYTAADAYAKATTVDAGMLEYHIERLTYLTRQFPADTARITAALTASTNQFGDIAQILTIEAKWLSGQGRYADAITAWERVKLLSPGRDTTAIDAEIARLKAKQ